MKNVKMRLLAIILCISFVVSGIGPMPTLLAAEAPLQSGSVQKNNQSNLFNEQFIKTNSAQTDSVQSNSVQSDSVPSNSAESDSVQADSDQKNAGDEIQTGSEGNESEPSNLINITTDISSDSSAEVDEASSMPDSAEQPLKDVQNNQENNASVQNVNEQTQAGAIASGITLEAMTKYTGVKTRVARGELPAALQGFSKIMVVCSVVPYNVAELGLPQWITSAYKGTYDDKYYISSVSQTGDLYALVVLFDNEENPLGYYETNINVPLGQQVQEITSGVNVSSPEPLGYMVDIVREELPEALQGYSTYSTMLSYDPFNVPENGLPPWLDNTYRNDYSDGSNSFGVGEARSWTVLLVLYDSQDNPIGYYESTVEITVGIQLPTITSGIRLENLSDYLGFSTIIERADLPEFARGFSKISVQRMNSPFEIQQYGIQRWVSGGYKQTYTEPVSTTVDSPNLWYALVILFDANENPIGYLETTVNVTPGIQVPAVTSGINFENMAAYNGFYTSVTNNSLPEFVRDFSKITVNINSTPYNVAQAGIPGHILNGYKQTYSNPILTGVDRPGTYSVLVVLYDANENPIGYMESNITVSAATNLPRVSSGLTLKNSSIYRGIEATVSRDQLPEFARQFSKITGTVSYAPFDVAQNGLPGWMANSYKKIYENPYLVSVYGYQNYYVLIVLFDNQDNPIGYYETSFNAENQITLPALEAGISLESSTDSTGFNIRVNRSLLPENAVGFSRIRAIESSDSYNVSQNGLPTWIEDGYSDEYQEPYYPFNTYGLGERNILVILFDNSNLPVGYFETKVNILEALPTPQNILLSSSDSSVHITWDNVEGATGYELLIGENTSVTVSTAEYTHSGLLPVTQYGYRIRAIDENNPGRFSDWSAAFNKYTILPVPSNITATAYENSISLSWDTVEGALQYEIVTDGGTAKIVHGNSYLHSGLEPNSEHSYKLRAIYTYNIELSSNWSETVSKKTRLRTPSDIWAKTAIRSIELKWNPIEGATGYELTADGQKVTVTGTSYIHSGLEPDSLHTYRLRAINDNGNQSEESAELKVKTKKASSEISSGISFESNTGYTGINTIVDKSQLPAFAQDFSKICLLVEKEPFNIEVNGLPEAVQYTKKEVYKAPYYFSGFDKPGNYDVLIVLFDINENPVGYMESEVNLTAGGLETPLIASGVSFKNNDDNRGFNTIIDRNSLPETVRNFSKIYVHSMREPFKENVEQNGIPGFIRNMDKFTYTAPYFTTNVYENGQYNVLLILVDAANNPIGYFESQINVTGPAKLPVPQNIRASSTDRAVVLMWDAVAGADGYEIIADNIYYYVTGTEYVHMNLPANTFHNYQVRASVPMTPEKSSEWSQVISKLTLLQAPAGFYTTVTSNSVELYWNTVPGASYYEVLADGQWVTVYGTSYFHNNLQPDTMHVYQVKAKNFEGNESILSYEIIANTKKTIQPVTTGIKLENSSSQNYFNTVITRNSLPEWARDFSKIRVITSKSPFNVAENGINPSYTSWSDWYYDPSYSTYVNTLGNWYVLVLLFDYANNPIGYLESSINVALPQDDHGNDFSTATPVKAGQSIPGVITAGDVDFFAFTPTISGSYTMYTESSMDTYGYLYDSNQQLITYNDDSIGYNFSITAILQANKTYYIKVRHYDQSSGTGAYVFKVSSVAGGVQPLSVPTNLSYTASGTEINLKWDSVAGATEYEVLVDNLTTEIVYEAKFVHSGLVSGSTHSYKVRAIDSANPDRTSQWSETLLAYIKLETPGNILATPGLKQIGLTWNEVEGANGYEVLIDGVTTEAVNEATFTHGNLSSGSTHSYKIRAISSENLNITSQWSELLWVSTLLETPLNIVAKPGPDSIAVTWDSVAGASNYEIEADNKIYEVSKNNYSHMGLEPQTSHTYRVRSKNGNIYSEWSSAVNATTSLAIPLNITAVPTVSQITISWDKILLATGYEILIDGEQNEFVTTPSFIHAGLSANTTHTYKVRAVYENNQAIVSDWSQPLEVSTLLNAPENINTKVLSNSVELTWDSVDGATAYEVEADGSVAEVTSATYIHKDINPNSTHVYRVRAKNGSLFGEWSNKVTVTTTLSIPGNVSASSSVSTITVKWNAVAEATAYDLLADDVLVEKITATSYIHKDLQGGTVHKYKVRARNGDISGPWSNEVSVTTLLSTVVSGSIKKDTLWTAAESPYELQGNVTIEAGVTLTIESGVIIKTSSSSSRLTVQGKVSAIGLPDKPIIFTAPKDSLVGGNGSGFDWYGITVGSSGEFTGDYVKIRYAGGGRNYGNAGNAISTEGKLVLTNSEVSHTYGTGISVETQGTKDITVENSDLSYNSVNGIYISKYGTGTVSIYDNTITNNGNLPISVYLDGLSSSIFGGISDNEFSGNKYNNLNFDGIGISGSIATNMSLSKNKYILTGSVTVPSGIVLTAEGGTVTLAGNSGYSLRVDGTLNAAGTESNPVVFTAPKDAEYGNSNGAAYDWYGITVSDTGEFTGDSVKVRYAGGGRSYGDKGNAIDTEGKLTLTNSEVSNTYGTGINVYTQGTQDVTVENCVIRDSLRNGIYIGRYGTGSVSIKGNSVTSNANLPIAVYLDGLGSSIFGGISGNEFSGNKYNNLNFDGIGISGALKSDVTLSKNLYIITGYIGVTSGKILTMQPGVRILDSGSHNINVEGILRAIGTETDPIIFTAPKDAEYGNGNGATYDWYGITVADTGEFTGDYIKIRYAGGGRSYGDKGNAIDTDGKLTLTNSEVSNTYGTGINIYIQGTQDVTVENCIIRDSLRNGIYIGRYGTGSVSIKGNSVTSNANLPIAVYLDGLGSSIFGGISGNEFSGNKYNNLNFDGIGISGALKSDVTLSKNLYIITGYIGVTSGKILTMQPGVRILDSGSHNINVEGILRAIGTETDPIIFTAPKDAEYGNGNGATYDWYGITVADTGEFTGDYIKIRYAGGGRSYGDKGNAIDTDGKLTLTNSEVSNTYGTGINIYIQGTQDVTVENCIIRDSLRNGIYIGRYGTGSVSIKGNSVTSNANLPIAVYLDGLGSSIFGGISGNEFSGNKYNNLNFDGIGISGALKSDVTLSKNLYIITGYIGVTSGKILTMQPGVRILDSGSHNINVEGILRAIGTETDPIIFTAPKDAEYGNSNGATYDWYGITVSDTGEFIGDYVKVRYAGGGRSYGDKGSAIDTDGKLTLTNSEVSNTYGTGINIDTQGTQDVTVENCIIRDSLRSGIYINGFGTGVLSIRDNRMSNNANLPIFVNLNRLGSSIFGGISNNEFTGNSYGGSSFDGIGLSGKLLVDVTLTENQYINVGSISVPAGKTMTIEQGVRMLADGEWNSSNQIHVEGILRAIGTEAKPVIFTAPKDELYGNGNGQTYNWYGITVTETGEFTGDHIKIRYAGGGRSYQGRGRSIETSGKLVLTNSEVSHSYETGIYVDTTGLQDLVVENCSVNDNPLYGVFISGFGTGILSIKDNRMSNNANLPIVVNLSRLGSSIFGGIRGNEFTGNSYGGSSFDGVGLTGELALDVTLTKNQYINTGSLRIPTGKTMTIQPGVRILAGGPHSSYGIYVEGILRAIGTEADPIIFTAPKDEVYGNGNGQTFDWYGINIRSTGEFTGDNIKVRYAGGSRGYGYKAMSIEVNGKLVLTNSEVSYSGGTGIYLDTDIQPVLKTVTIEHNEFGMENANNQSMTVDAQYNYWGAVDGPSIRMYDEKLNRWYWVGTGDKVGDGINYYPYLGQELKYKFHFGGNGTNAPTGNYSRTFTDMSISSPGFSLDFNRSYNSGDDRQNGPFGQGWTFGFESNIKDYDGIIPIKLVRLPDGSVQTFDVNSDGTFTARDNRNTLERKENGTYLLTTKDQNQFGFNSNGYLEFMKDKYGNTVSIEVDSDGKVRGLTDQTGRHFIVTYENGHITAIKDDVSGRTVRYEYENGLLTKAYDPMNNVTGYSYDAQGYLKEIRNSSNKLTEAIQYINTEGENLHKVDKTTDVNGKTQTYTYDNVNRKTIITDNNGRQTVKWYDSAMFVTNQRDYEEKIETTEYDTGSDGVNKYGEEKALTDRNGNTTQFDRDERGNIKKITYPDLTTKEFEYDDRNNVIKEKDQQGRYTFYIYDAAKVFLLKKAQPLDGTSSYVEGTSDVSKFAITRYVYYTDSERQQLGYKAKGLVKTIEDPMGSITSYTYYSDGSIKELIETQDSDNPGTRKTVYSYNQDRMKIGEVSPKGYRTEYIYDKNGNLEKTVKYGEDGTTAESVSRTTYDEEGRKKQDISPKLYNSAQDHMQNHSYSGDDGYRYTYYDNGKLHTVTDSENNTTTYTYDIYGNMATETKPNQSIYLYEYDVMNRLTKISFKENAQAAAIVLEEYSYTILGDKRTQKTEKRYINDTETTSTIYTYDYAGRPVEQKNADGTLAYTEYYGDGKIKRTTDEDGYSTYYYYGKYDSSTNTSYDELYVPVEYADRTVKYAYTRIDYDKSGRKIKEVKGVASTALNAIPSKLVITDYIYYKNGKLKEQSDSSGRKTIYTYDADGNVKSEEVFTEEQNSIITAYKNNYLGKPEEKTITVRKGDIAGNDTEDNDTIDLTTYLEYDKNGMLSTLKTPDGVVTTYQYDKLDRTISVSKPGTDENGNSVNISQSTEYDTEDNVVSVTDGNGNTSQNTYDKRGLLLSVKNAEGGITAYYYDRAGRKVAEVSPKAYGADKSLEEMDRTTYSYDVMDRLKTVTYVGEEKKYNPTSHTWTTSQVEIVQKAYKYDNRGNVIKELDALGYQAGTGFTADEKIETGYGTEYTLNPAGKVTTIVDAESKQNFWRYKSQYTYDALGRVLTETNANRTVNGYSYDDAGNITKVTVEWYFNGTEKIVRTSTYDLLGNEKTQTDGNGNTTRYQYNSFGKLYKTINPGDSTIPEYSVIHQYDVMGKLAVKKDSSGTVDTYSYDSYGRLLGHTQSKADGSESITTESRYDKNGNKRFETDGNGVTTEYTYDGLNRLKSESIKVSGIEQLTTYGYDANGNQTVITDWRGNSYTSSYDGLGRIIDKKDPYGISIEKYEYNNNNVQVKSYDALDNVTQYSYDRNNRLLSTTDPENHVTSQEYDSAGNISSKTDGSNNTTSYEYDEQNRLVKVTDAGSGVTSYTYDLNGNMLTQTDGKGNQVIWEYNAANKVTRRIDEGGRTGTEGSYTYSSAKVESYTYNADGSLASQTDRNGIVTRYTYDAHGRLTSKAVGEIAMEYTYDKNGNQLTITDQTGKTTRTYDQLNRVVTKEVPNMGESVYTYDITAGIPEGNWAESTTDPKGNETVKTYDRAGRLKTVTAEGKTTTYNYYDNGARESVEYSDGSREAYTYYKDNLLRTLINTKADGTVIDNYSYTYDAAHNETSKVDAKGTTVYTYDELNRLETITEPNGRTTSYRYDRAGNREWEAISEGSNSTVKHYRYNEQNRLFEVTTAVNGVNTGTTHYSYDNNGNMTSMEVNGTVTAVYTYDQLNQLIKTVTDGKTVENRYNGEGLRVEKTVDGVLTRYLYEYDKVVLEVDGTGRQTGRNVYGTNLLMRTAGTETYIYMYNGHADVTALLRPDGTVAATYYYDAFGNITDTTGSASNSITYAGYQYDSETGLYYLNARMYDPKTARFLQEDTYRGEANDPLSLNLYTYVNNNPVKYDDPTGHWIHLLVGGLIGSVAGAVMDIGSQMIFEHKSFNEIDWKSVAVSTVDGGISGVLGAATGGTSLIATAGKQTGKQIIKKAVKTMAVEAATAGASNVMAQYAVKGEVDWSQAASTALISGVSGGLGSGLSSSKALNTFVDSAKEKTSKILSDISDSFPSRQLAGANGLSFNASSINGLEDVTKTAVKKNAIQENYINVTKNLDNAVSIADDISPADALKNKMGNAGVSEANYTLFNKTHKGSLPVPKGTGPNGGRLQSHHGLQKEWSMENLKQYGYDPDLAPTITIETGKGFPHTSISNAQNLRRNARVASGNGKWSSTLQDELQYIVDDFTNAGYSRGTIEQVMEQQYKMLDKLGVNYERIGIK